MVNYAVWKRYPELNPIDLWEPGQVPEYRADYQQDVPFITPFLLAGEDNPVVLVFPGGGYEAKAEHESMNIARRMNALGFSAFVVDYRVQPYLFPVPHLDAWRSVRYVRCHAKRFGINPNKIIALGFSAGGNLVSAISTVYDDGNPDHPDPVERVSSRPDAMVLCYAPVNMFDPKNENRHKRALALGGQLPDELKGILRPTEQVNADTIPAFLWQTSDDETVDPHYSLEMYSALQRHGVPVEMHLYRHGHHGVHLALEDPSVGTWSELCAKFLRQLGF